MYLRNAWYVAACAEEIGRRPMARTLLGDPVVLYRGEAGKPVALFDRCAHRQAPLSLGECLEGERIRCNYHGLVYEASGQCVHVPGQSQVPPEAKVRSFPVAEKYTWIWFWPGDPAKADEALIPDYHYNEMPGLRVLGERIPMKGQYQLLVDNLMDLSHLAYTHRKTIGVEAVAEKAAAGHRMVDGTVVVERETLDHGLPPGLSKAFKYDRNVDRWQTIRFVPPSGVVIQSHLAPTGEARDPATRLQHGWTQHILNFITPETANTLHYFWRSARNYGIDDAKLDEMTWERIRLTFCEDTEMIEGQQRRQDLDRNAPKVDINYDSGPLAARRILAAMIAAEQGTRAAAE